MIEPESAGTDPPGQLFRLWVEFDVYAALGIPEGAPFGLTGGPPAWWQGCGVSGYDEADCLALLRREIFRGGPLPPLRRSIPNLDVSTLPDDIRAQVGVPVYRGVWFPANNRRPRD